jgi:hypothetical protein
VSLIGEKRYAEALALHRERNPFASVCARVCFHTCEDKCRRSMLDAPVSIRGIKRFMVDQEVTIQLPEIRENAENVRRKIAIVGAGGPLRIFPRGWAIGRNFRGRAAPAELVRRSRPTGCREIVARSRMVEHTGVGIFPA